MTLTRYTDTAPIDYMIAAADGEWVPASEALALEAEVEHLRAEHLHPCGVKEAELRELRAEVERLRRDLYSAQQQLHPVDEAQANEARAMLRARLWKRLAKEYYYRWLVTNADQG